MRQSFLLHPPGVPVLASPLDLIRELQPIARDIFSSVVSLGSSTAVLTDPGSGQSGRIRDIDGDLVHVRRQCILRVAYLVSTLDCSTWRICR